MRLRPLAVALFELESCRAWICAINARAYTIFLWGPIANDAAGRIVHPRTGPEYLLEFALSLALLAVCVRLFGPVEDWAARRKPVSGRTAANAGEATAGDVRRTAA